MDAPSLDRWQQLDTLFAEALARPADERTAFLRAACGDDPGLYAGVLALLEDAAVAERALGESATDFATPLMPGLRNALAASDAEDDLAPGAVLGPYRVDGVLGRGGMGTVYRAERADGAFDKTVALKVIRRGLDTDDMLARFRRERQVLAALDHPSIARLLDGGASDDGRPFLVMELAEGQPITTYADHERLDVMARLALFEQAAEAVQHAHRRLVVHRDLKPSNVLVTDEGRVKLLDFGIAKLLDADASEGSMQTRTGLRPLTPAYAAPEQRRGEAVTTATDVYALGVLLYELLTGNRPTGQQAPTPPPSERVTDESARTRATTPERLRRRLRGDLDTIVLKALREDPDRRYPSVEALLDDLRRHREGLPVQARPESLGYRVGSFVRRHRVGVTTVAAFVVVLIGALTLVSFQQRATARERDRAEAERDRAEEVTAFLEGLFDASDPFAAERLDTLRVTALLDEGVAQLDALDDQPLVRAQMLGTIGRIYVKLYRFDEAEPLLREALALREAHAGPETEATAESLYDLARLLYHVHQEAASDTLAARALDVRRRLYGDADVRVAYAEMLLAFVRESNGDAETAERLVRHALATFEGQLGEAHPDVAEAWSRLAAVLVLKGDFPDASEAWQTAIALHRRHGRAQHPLLATALGNLAFFRVMQGDYGAAEALQREAFDIMAAVLGEHHPRLVPHQNRLGLILRKQGRYAEAEAVLQAARATQRDQATGNHSGLSTTLTALASLYREQGRLAEAVDAQREAHQIALDHLDDTAQAMYAQRLGSLLTAQRRYAEAEALLVASLQGIGEDNPHAQSARVALAEVRAAQRGEADPAGR